MRKYLLPKGGNFYKANLHCHSTVSDGRNTPEEMKEYYKAHGYQILAITDHDLLVDHSDLNDEDFVTITGYEYSFLEFGEQSLTDVDTYRKSKLVELNIYPRDPHNVEQICYTPAYTDGYDQRCLDNVKYKSFLQVREYSLETIQRVIDEAVENDCIVGLNHPAWSMETQEFIGKLTGLFSIEVYNNHHHTYSCFDYDNFHMYDELIKMGKTLYCTASDDNHQAKIYDDPLDIRPWCFTMIKAKELTHKAVFEAMEQGNMYVSQGPEITELYIEDSKIHMHFSNAKCAIQVTDYKYWDIVEAPAREYINCAEFKLAPYAKYYRFVVIDEYGRRACTRAYFT